MTWNRLLREGYGFCPKFKRIRRIEMTKNRILQFNSSDLMKSLSTIPEKSATVLPKLPIPALEKTLQKYLKSVKPFLNTDELKQSQQTVKEMLAPGGLGDQLQCLLEKRAECTENWLEEWWLHNAYLGYREPVVVFSSPGQIFPQQTFKTEEDYLKCATKIVEATLIYKRLIDENKIPPEKMGNNPLDMQQYEKVFGTTRNPQIPRDQLKYHPHSNHIVVFHNNNIYKVIVKSQDGYFNYKPIYEQLKYILNQTNNCSEPIGILTSDKRDNWSNSFKELRKDCESAESLEIIEKSLFALCLDEVCPPQNVNKMTTTAMQLIHGGGPTMNAGNRWYDKTLQFIVNKNGGIGMTYEHSPAEGQPIAILMDFIMQFLKKDTTSNQEFGAVKPELLKFNVNDKIKEAILAAEKNMQALVDDLDVRCFSFNNFGKEMVKEFKLSPDSFVQMALQLAFYRLHLTPGAQYETASLRKFIGGRTETIRSCSEESILFAKSMLNTSLSPQSKANALRIAVAAHKDYTNMALNGSGIDRHLLGLRLIAIENNLNVPLLFKDPGFIKSTHYRVSTSQVASIDDGFMCYGPLVNDGYSACYNPRKNNINFGTSAYHSCKETSATKWQEAIETSLNDMKEVLMRAPQAKL